MATTCDQGGHVIPTPSPEIVYVEVEVPAHTVEVVDRVEPVYVGTGELREFESKVHLRIWLNQTGINQREYIPTEYDCEDFAIDLVKLALKDGYWMGLVDSGEHIYNFTMIGNNVYWIEPQSNMTDVQIRKYGTLD
jgi:hypothetical protein